MSGNSTIIDGNQATAHIAHKTNEVIAIYPITPASPMGELADEWSALGRRNIWGGTPEIIEMQSEGGAAGAVHGAVQAGALTTTFTASQGLLLMIPNMYKMAGELSSVVIHVAARSLAAQALSIFGDHSDVMACRATGFAMLASGSVQEAMDMALIAQTATLRGRIPFLHFFDGFRTSHELMKVELIDDETIHHMVDAACLIAHRERAMTPDRPVLRGTSQNPDVYFQGRETVNPYYQALPDLVQQVMDELASHTGRQYRLFDYHGAPDAERVILLMGSGAEAVEETVEDLLAQGQKVGLLRVRLYRPFSARHLIEALPSSLRALAVLDRCKDPGAGGEPLYKDVVTALAEQVAVGGEKFSTLPRILGGRYGLSSKEFTPGMIRAVFDNLSAAEPKNHFTIGIHDDVTHSSLEWDRNARNRALEGVNQCLFYGLGSDGTVSANKNTLKIIGEETDQFVQGYFVYDSKKAGAVTVSHLRFSDRPIRASYLIGDGEASFIGCHQPQFVERFDLLEKAAPGCVFLLNSDRPPEQVWSSLPRPMQQQMLDKQVQFWVIDAYRVARDSGMGRRINTIMQTAFFAISGVLPRDEAIARIKQAVEKTYGRKGRKIVERNFAAIDAALDALHQVALPDRIDNDKDFRPPVPADAPEFVRDITALLIAGKGDELPVSKMPADGSWPLGTAAYEKRSIALELPKWDPELCIECGKCPFVCPHAAIRSKTFTAEVLADAPEGFLYREVRGSKDPQLFVAYQLAPDDCTGCSLCAHVCPARDKSNASHKSLDMVAKHEILEQERINWEFFSRIPEHERTTLDWKRMKSAMLAQPLFEFSGACLGCGETPYIRLATQMFGDRMLIANATGCSSIYGGNLPTTPYSCNPEGRGPAWSNSLFEDNAEFGLGFRLAVDQHIHQAQVLLADLGERLDRELVRQILEADQSDEAGIEAQRQRVARLKADLQRIDDDRARRLLSIADYLVRKSVWIIGGDGWAYDIGFGGLDHALASGKDINLLVLDTEVYSNTGGQTSKATPRGAVAKFSAAGKPSPKKDIGMIAMAYGHVYVASIASGAKDVQTLRAFREAESWHGPSLIIAYSPCIAHGVDLSNNLNQQHLAVDSGHWPLYRYDPRRRAEGRNPLQLDSKKPKIPLKEYYQTEARFSMLWRSHPDVAERLLAEEQQAVLDRYHHLEQLASLPVDAEEAAS